MINNSISLIMINLNRSEYIAEAIESVLKQTNNNWELIIVDDASSDDSLNIIKKYLDNNKIKLIVNNKHLGIVYSRRKAIENSSSEIIGIIDSDDVLDREAVETMLWQYNINNSGLIYSQMIICDKKLRQISKGTNRQIPLGSSNLIQNCISHFFTFKKTDYMKVGGYDYFFNRCSEDKDLFYKLEEVTEPLFIDKTLYYYRMNPSSVSSYGFKKFRGRLLYFIAKLNAYTRRKINNSPKKIKFMELFPQRRMINTAKTLLDKFYFPLLIRAAIKSFRKKSLKAKTPEELWRLASDFRYGPNKRGLNINIKPAQVPQEIIGLMSAVKKIAPKIILEIGTATGGTLFFWTKIAPPDALIISLDLPFGKFGGGYLSCQKRLFSSFSQDKQTIKLIQADSHKSESLEQVRKILAGRQVDFMFIDGDHSYNGAKQDFENYKNLVHPGGLIALHDIAPNQTDLESQVDRLWSEIKAGYKTEEFIADPGQGWAGIGLITV